MKHSKVPNIYVYQGEFYLKLIEPFPMKSECLYKYVQTIVKFDLSL